MNDDSGDLTLFAVNRDQEDSLSLEGELRRFATYEVVEHLILQHNDPKATNTAKHPNNVAPLDGGDAAMLNGKFTALLPRLPWSVIRMSQAST